MIALLAGDNVGVRDYLIACGASEIVVNPDSALMMLGVAAGNLFLRNALASSGVEAQTLQWKEYKGAAEMFSREAMSPGVRESLDAIINDWKTIVAETVAAARKLAPAKRATNYWRQGFIGARTACAAGLADRTGYIEEIRTELDPDNEDSASSGCPRYLRRVAYFSWHGIARGSR